MEVYMCSKKAKDLNLIDIFESLPEGRFVQNIVDGPGLSLCYSDFSANEVLERLQVEDERIECVNPERPVRKVRLKDPENGLCVTIEYILYTEYNAVLYGAVLENKGKVNIQHVTLLNSLDITAAPLQNTGDPLIHTLGGGLTHYHYPPQAYRLYEWHMLGPTQFAIDSGTSGRSSNKDLPFFFIEDGNRASGIFGGIEWSGLWHFTFTRSDEPQPSHFGRLGPNKFLTIQGGMDGVNLELKTGEVFYMPRILLGFYKGDINCGRNCLRHFIDEWSPRFGGKPPMPLIQGCPDGCYSKYQVNSEVCRANSKAMAELGAEYYMIANWQQDKEEREKTYSATSAARGSWIPDSKRWPGDSLKKISEHVSSLGMIFGLWTDIEVASSESTVAIEHPDWVLYLEGISDGLLNFALPEVQEWAIETYDRLIKEYNTKWFFLDNNIDPAPFWNKHEPEHRKGRLQHDFIRGIWRVWEWILENHADVGLENCSSGGRRIDLGTLARTHRSQSSDQFRHPDSIRYQSSGFSTVIPGNRISTYMCCGLTPYTNPAYHANFGGMLALSEDFENWNEVEYKKALKHIEVYKSLRNMLNKDFYPLFPQPQSLREWDGWQYNDAENEMGFVLVFRVRSIKEMASPLLYGLKPNKEYILTNPYTGKQEKYAGESLMTRGLPFALQNNESCLLIYRLC